MDNAIVFQGLGVILALFFIFLTYMNTKTWRWLHVTASFFVFGAAVAFVVYASLTLKTRNAWLEFHDKTAAALDAELEKQELLAHGDPADILGKTPSVNSAREELARVLLDRGRVWRECTPTINADGTATISTTPPAAGIDPAAPAAAAAPKKHNIEAKTVLHVFKEGPSADGLYKVPMAYLGEFVVTGVGPDSVTVQPAISLLPEMIADIQRVDGTWVLYESAPPDGHDAFEGLDAAQITAMIPKPASVSQADYDKLIASYVKDGQRADDSDSPDEVWMKVKFVRTHTMVVDAPTASGALSGSPYDTEGMAIVPHLRAGKEVEFEPGSEGVFDTATAQQLIDDGIAEKIEPIYQRRLNDYEGGFELAARKAKMLADTIANMQRDIDTIAAATAKADEQIAQLDSVKTKLTADLAKVAYERDELGKYQVSLTTQLNKTRADLSRLYLSNKELNRQLVEINNSLQQEVDRRTKEATASR
ncbi:hypothetical protein Psta_4727 [Pirellula staleyi DSM 6068]|uniref:Uncharacterized protein n=1 Tax=Pirellula staleyi (strain ATCC 27377 / DSM 6068 / ICPB 4128) TaxID=530564 RepID=D2R837_PIRSD|nr:hypothetical protein [Pirellula staleyi]ADB19368.1 hypothetical protein Psta_4727 [Pirellula staleyi DSM 6068]